MRCHLTSLCNCLVSIHYGIISVQVPFGVPSNWVVWIHYGIVCTVLVSSHCCASSPLLKFEFIEESMAQCWCRCIAARPRHCSSFNSLRNQFRSAGVDALLRVLATAQVLIHWGMETARRHMTSWATVIVLIHYGMIQCRCHSAFLAAE